MDNVTEEPVVTPPNPGSKEALALGCKCAVLDNHYGKGFGNPATFWVSQICLLHGWEESNDHGEETANNNDVQEDK